MTHTGMTHNRFRESRCVRLVLGGLLMIAATCVFSTSVEAQNKTWVGSFNGNWSDGDNWSPVGAPVSGNVTQWNASSVGNLTSNNDILGLSVASLVFNAGPGGPVTIGGNALTLDGNVTGTYTGTATINMDLVMSAARTFGPTGSNGQLIVNGVVSGGTSQMTVSTQNGAVVHLNAANTFTGNFTVSQGTASINTLGNSGVAQSIGEGSNVNFGFGTGSIDGFIIYNGASTSSNKTFGIGQTNASITRTAGGGLINNGTGAVTWTGAQNLQGITTAARTFTLGGSNADDNNWQSAIQNNNNVHPGLISFAKTGAGKWMLSGNNTYTGNTSVTAGTLLINGNQSGATGAVAVAGNATLGGIGTVGGNTTIQANAILAPGNSPGTLTFSDDLFFDPAALLEFELDALNQTPGSGINDLVVLSDVSSFLTLDGIVNVTSDPLSSGLWTLFQYSGTLVDNVLQIGSINLTAGHTASVDTSTLGEVNLVVTVVPEPTGIVLAAAGVMVLGGVLRRRHGRVKKDNRQVACMASSR